MITLLAIKLADKVLEQVRRNHHDAIAELQRMRATRAVTKADVVLADGFPTTIRHGLGQVGYVLHSPPRGATATGRIEEVRDGSVDRTQYVVIKATGYGATITVDLEIKPL